MAITYFSILEFQGEVFILWKEESGCPEISLVIANACGSCRQPYMVIPPIPAAAELVEKIRAKNKPILSTGFSGVDLALIVCDCDSFTCPQCEQEIRLPTAEILDPERTSYGRYAMGKNIRTYPEHPRNKFSWKEPGTWREIK